MKKNIFNALLLFFLSWPLLNADEACQAQNMAVHKPFDFLFSKEAKQPSIKSEEKEIFDQVYLLMTDDLPAAIKLLEEHITLKSSAPMDYMLGMLYLNNGGYINAEKYLNEAINKAPGFMRAYSALARALIEQGKINEATKQFKDILLHGNPSPSTLTMIGYTFLMNDQVIPAETAYRQAVLLEPNDINGWLGLAKSLVIQERNLEARKILQEILDNNHSRAEIWFLLANTEIALGNNSEAIITLETAKIFNLLSFSAFMTLGDLYLQQGSFQEAYMTYKEALGQENVIVARTIPAIENMVQVTKIEYASELLKIVESKIDIAAEKFKDNEKQKVLFIKAKINHKNNNLKEAENIYRKLLELDPLNGEYLIALADIFKDQGEFERALTYYERAERNLTDKRSSLLKQAEVNVELKRYKAAIEILKKAQSIKEQAYITKYIIQLERLL